MAEKENLIKLAKGDDKTKAPVAKKSVEKVVEKKPTPAEERDIKAKAKVAELLKDVNLEPKRNEELLEMNEEPKRDVEWLEEQVSKLSEENEKLRSEAGLAKEDYSKIFKEFQESKKGNGVVLTNTIDDSALKTKITQLFSEIQTNYLAMGRNFVIVPAAFLNRLIMFFPFLEGDKKF
jgi:hypothetical protein